MRAGSRVFLDDERPGIEVKRRGQPAEAAAVITFLCSERPSFENGSNYRAMPGPSRRFKKSRTAMEVDGRDRFSTFKRQRIAFHRRRTTSLRD